MALNQIVEKLSVIPDLSGLGDIIEAVRSVYDVDHVYYYAVSLGVDAPIFEETKGGGMTQDAGIWRRDGRSMAAISYTPEWIVHYFEQQFDTVDPVMQSAATAFAPIDWADLDWTSPGRRRFF
ncbi:MAG: autoinducer binding domain-containing protein, partial [Pseudomonadota bacterium]